MTTVADSESEPGAPLGTTGSGDVRVDEVIAGLARLDGMDPAGQLVAFTQMHDRLTAVLDGEDDPPPPSS